MKPPRRLISMALALVLSLGATVALAQSEATKKEARERFDRGLTLFNQGDDTGALAEFQRAYELIPHPLVLYNIGLVYATMRRPVEASDALGKLVEAPGSLDTERLENARKVRAEQIARVGEIEVVADVPGAAVEVDNVEVAKTPLSKPLRVSIGQHLIAIVARGYLPARRSVTVAGGARARAAFELVKSEGRPAHVTLRMRVPDVEVWIDSELVGKTPLPASLAIAPGRHTLELKRAGYVTARQPLDVGEGSVGEVAIEPSVDHGALGTQGGSLALEISEPDAVVFVDEAPRGAYATPLRLAHGRHMIRIERAHFFPFQRMVDVPQGATTTVTVDLEPKADYRASYRSSAVSQRTWGWVSVGGGGAALIGSGLFLLVNRSNEQDAEQKFDEIADTFENGGRCDKSAGGGGDACDLELELALDDLTSVRSRYKFGLVGLGVGAAAVGFGAFLLLSNDDPDRYEPKPESDVFGSLEPGGWISAESSWLGVRGRF
jgi:hypothetical protein